MSLPPSPPPFHSLIHPLDPLPSTIITTEKETVAAQALLQLHTTPRATKNQRRHHRVVATTTTTLAKNKRRRPRWQAPERLVLLRAVVQEKQLHDMSTFHWDKIARAVRRTKKACKDQWRREILPMLLKETPW